jgi:hypothetical protein
MQFMQISIASHQRLPFVAGWGAGFLQPLIRPFA